MTSPNSLNASDYATLTEQIKQWGMELGFQQVGIAKTDLAEDAVYLQEWLDKGFHGSMEYMAAHDGKRGKPHDLWPGTQRVISVRLDYSNRDAQNAEEQLTKPNHAYVSRYALGRDYHKVLRNRLKKLAQRIETHCQDLGVSPYGNDPDSEFFSHRAFVDSAPVLEKALARNAGLGWIGKHTNLINSQAGSWFFLGELFTNLPLLCDQKATNHCGTCHICMDVCPTAAIVGPYQVDARRCISYLTIENKAAIPLEYRKAMGNRIYGCDDCQLFCPWNKFARTKIPDDFNARHTLDSATLVELFAWTKEQFEERTRGSAIRRTGYRGWRRNIAVALGNAASDEAVLDALSSASNDSDDLVREHVNWALAQHTHLK